MAIKKVFTVTIFLDDELEHLPFDDLIEEGQDGGAVYGTECVETVKLTAEEANKQTLEIGSDGTFFDEDADYALSP